MGIAAGLHFMDKSRAIYGIDLGTTYSCIALIDQFDQPVVLRNFEGDSTTPSVVYFENNDYVVVGREAKGMLTTEPEHTVAFIKREMGIDDSFDKYTNRLPFHYDPSEISAFILKKIVQDANDLGDSPEPIKDVVITCPAYFGNKERMQTKQAGIIAGLNVLSIINEPTAAAIAYGIKSSDTKTVLVYDLGGGTFDVTIIRVDKGNVNVIATGGDFHLGGVDWDTALADYILSVFNEENGTDYDLDYSPSLKYTLLLEAELKKKLLTAKESVKALVQFEGMSSRVTITRDLFEELTTSYLEDTITEVSKVIEIARQKGYAEIDEVLLVGGSSRMAQVKKRIDRELNCNAKLSDPDECIAKGAAIYAMNLAYEKAKVDFQKGQASAPPKALANPTKIVNVTSKTYGIGIIEEKVQNYIFANTSLPAKVEIPLYTVKDKQQSMDLPLFESDFTDTVRDNIVQRMFANRLSSGSVPITPNSPEGTRVDITMMIDEEGLLVVEARERQNQNKFSLNIRGIKSDDDVRKTSADFVYKTIE